MIQEEEYKENVEYIRSSILPALQEIQRDLAGMQSCVSVSISVDGQSGSVFTFISVVNNRNFIADSYSTNFFHVDNRKELDKKYNELAVFLKKYLA